jgi:hypothetical protein
MYNQVSLLLKRLDDQLNEVDELISWSCPVLSFGNLESAKIATIGLNPSNREFVDKDGNELIGSNRRFPTLQSLGLRTWGEANENHMNAILTFCYEYFDRNPYDGWFKKLDNIISGTSMSYYFPSSNACHLDLIPYATSSKWANLTSTQRNKLLESNSDTLGMLLRESNVKVLILNGQTVVDGITRMTNVELEKISMPDWTLPRKSGSGVSGFAYKGKIDRISATELKRPIHILGYNHNIQSSFGVTNEVLASIRSWISYSCNEILS